MPQKPLFEPADSGSVYPLMSLLPTLGNVQKLHELTSSLFARHERVRQILRDLELGEAPLELRRPYGAEEKMLKQVLEWLGADVGGGV
jgi:hypothetical protein